MTEDSPATLSIPLANLRFKGERDYLQGPDILSAALTAVERAHPGSPVADLDITFRAMARTGLALVDAASVPQSTVPFAQLKCIVGAQPRQFALVGNGQPIRDRHPFPEEAIVGATRIEVTHRRAVSARPLPFTNIERWVAMVKALHHAVYPGAPGKWLFVRGVFPSYRDHFAQGADHGCRITAAFNDKLTQSLVTVDGTAFGTIYFARN
jgi:hypothetical protein